MSEITTIRSPLEPVSEPPREALGQQGNLMSALVEGRNGRTLLKKKKEQQVPEQSKDNLTSPAANSRSPTDDLACSSSGTSSISNDCASKHMGKTSRRVRRTGETETATIDLVDRIPKLPVGEVHRCAWITPNSDRLYIGFHDEEWGLPLHDDRKLFELLVYSMALAELSWPTILQKRDEFRKSLDYFDPASVAQFKEKKVQLPLKATKANLLSEQKLRAVVENAKQILKVQNEYGSFSKYCWGFVNEKPIRNGHRYARQVPVKTPKAESMSKDLIHRGFCCVGPTVVYSFMQSVGMVNDHLLRCFRYEECNHVETLATNITPNPSPI